MMELFANIVNGQNLPTIIAEKASLKIIGQIVGIRDIRLTICLNIHLTIIYLSKGNCRNTWKRCKIRSRLAINILERRHWRRSGDFIVSFENISHLFLVFLLLTFKQVILSWAVRSRSRIVRLWVQHFIVNNISRIKYIFGK